MFRRHVVVVARSPQFFSALSRAPYRYDAGFSRCACADRRHFRRARSGRLAQYVSIIRPPRLIQIERLLRARRVCCRRYAEFLAFILPVERRPSTHFTVNHNCIRLICFIHSFICLFVLSFIQFLLFLVVCFVPCSFVRTTDKVGGLVCLWHTFHNFTHRCNKRSKPNQFMVNCILTQQCDVGHKIYMAESHRDVGC